MLLILCLGLTACGVKRPLIPPKDIPAYEERQRKKHEKIEQEQREFEEKAAAQKAADDAAQSGTKTIVPTSK